MREYDKPIEPTSEETERLMNQEFGYDPDKRGSMVMEAEEYARRQWADSAPEDYVEGSKNDYLQGYHDAMEKACEWMEKYMESLGYIDEWCRTGEDKFKKAMEE